MNHTQGVSDESNGHWPAEWYPHDATWLAWPHNEETWPQLIPDIRRIFLRKIQILAEVETVHVVGGPPDAMRSAQSQLGNTDRVIVHQITSNDSWIRDFGPTFVLNQRSDKLVGIDWKFNAWGNKYHPHDDDAAASIRICNAIPCERRVSRLTCEGGGLETDGEGTLLATSRSIATASRNPSWDRTEIETELMAMLGVEKVLWIDGGELEGDDTDSHIDQLVRFVRPGVVVAATASNASDSNAQGLETQYQQLREVTDAHGRQLELIRLPTPPPRFVKGIRMPESYCNFYIANEIVLVPQFGFRSTDDEAMKILAEWMPERQMIPLDASDLIVGRGAFHCATQQQPTASVDQPS